MGLIITNGQPYGGSVDNKVVELTQAEYDALPSSKTTDNKLYIITDRGYSPSAELTDYSNTTSGLSATNVQGAIDEVVSEKVDKTTSVCGKALSSNVTLYSSEISPNIISNADGDSKSVTSTGWVYNGTVITIPTNHYALIVASRGWRSGNPTAVGIATTSNNDYTIFTSCDKPSEFNPHAIEVTAFVTQGTYYLWSKASTGTSCEQMKALIF